MEEEIITVHIKTLDSKKIPFNVSKNINVAELKKLIENKTNVPLSSQRLIFKGKILKDDQGIDAYGVVHDCTLHMVERQQGIQENPPPSNQTTTTTPNPATGRPNFVMGTISLPDGAAPPELNQLLGNVLGSLGIVNPPNTSQQDSFQQIQHNLNNLNNSISQLQSSSTHQTSTTTQTSTNTNNIENTGSYLSQIDSAFLNIHPFLSHLASLLSQESSLQASRRTEAQNLASQLGPIFQNLGTILLSISSSISSIQMGSEPGTGQISAPRRVVAASGNIGVAIPRTIPNQTTPQGEQATNTQGQPIEVSMPLFTVSQREQNQSGDTNTRPAPNLNNLFATIASSMNQNRPPSQPTQTPPSQSTQTPPSQPTQTPPMSQSATPNSAPPNMANMLSQFLSIAQSLGSQSNVQTNTSAPLPDLMSQFLGAMEPGQQSNNQENSSQNTSTAAMLSQTFNAVNQAINSSQPSTISSVIESISQGLNSDNNNESSNQEETILAEILKKVMDSLTVPDMLAIMSGNWVPLQKMHPILKGFVRDVVKTDTSSSRLDQLASEIIESVKESLNEKDLPEEIKKKVKPGYEITSLSLTIMRKHVSKLLAVILSDLPPTAMNPHPFASAVKEWTSKFVEDLVNTLSQSMSGGLSDAVEVIKWFLRERLMFMGPEFSQMGTNMVTSYIMETYSHSQLTPNNQDPRTWENTIAVDELRQSTSPPQRAFSDSYNSGAPPSSKRRKKVKVTNPNDLLLDRVKELFLKLSISSSNSENILQELVQTKLPEKYIKQLKEDLKKRLKEDLDFKEISDKYPNASSLLE